MRATATALLLGLTPLPLTVYSQPVRCDSETMLSFTMVFVSVCVETTPCEKFGTTGTAAAGDATSSKSALAALQFTDHLPDGAGVRSPCRHSDGPGCGQCASQC